MVAVPDLDTRNGVSARLLRMIRDVQIPGDDHDHVWMGERIELAAEKLTDRYPHEFGQDLILTGLALGMGLDLSRVDDLEGWSFPDPWLSTVPCLLQCGFPKAGWRLVESDVLTVEPAANDARYAWRLDLRHVDRITEDWYELGTRSVLQPLREGLLGVTHGRARDTRIRVVASSLSDARDWVRRLREDLRASGCDELPLLVAG